MTTQQEEQVIDSQADSQRQQARAIWEELEAEEAQSAGQPPVERSIGRPEEEAQPAARQTEQEPDRKPEPRGADGGPLSDEERALLKQIPEVLQLVKSTVGRVGSLQSELAKLGKQAAATQGAGEQKPSGQQIDRAAASPAAWEALKKDFPDWAEGVEQFVATRIPSTSQTPDVSAIVTKVAGEFEEKRREDGLEVVTLFDPQWRLKTASKEFAAWIHEQPEAYRVKALSTWKPSEILSTVRDFDAALKKKTQPAPEAPAKPSNSRLRSAAIPSGVSRVNLTKPESEMTPEEYWAYLDAQEAKQRA